MLIDSFVIYGRENCTVPENIHTPPTEGIGISWGVRASMRTKNLKKCMKLNWNFQRGGEVLEKSLPGGGMDIFWNHTIHKNRLLVHAVFLMHHLNTFWSIIIIHCILKK